MFENSFLQFSNALWQVLSIGKHKSFLKFEFARFAIYSAKRGLSHYELQNGETQISKSLYNQDFSCYSKKTTGYMPVVLV